MQGGSWGTHVMPRFADLSLRLEKLRPPKKTKNSAMWGFSGRLVSGSKLDLSFIHFMA